MLSSENERRLHRLVEVFLAENENINLTAFRTPEQCWVGNVLDSVAFLDLLPILNLTPGAKIIDIGTGGGFPLLPLAICLPEMQFMGIDSVQKKLSAIERIYNAMIMHNITLIMGRAEEVGRRPSHREMYDVVTARAIAALPALLEYAAPLVKIGGFVVAWKSLTIDQELIDSLLARAEFSCHLERQHEYALPGDWGRRQLLVFKKTSKLSDKYPRAVGVPAKNPIL